MNYQTDTTYLYEDLEAVRQSGLVNMGDRPGVIEVAEMLDLEDLASYLRPMTPKEYAFVLRGFSRFLGGITTDLDVGP